MRQKAGGWARATLGNGWSSSLAVPEQAHEQAVQRHETDEHRAERLVKEWMSSLGWTESQLVARAKGHAQKAAMAQRLGRQTPMTRAWIAQRPAMGSASNVSHLTKPRPAK